MKVLVLTHRLPFAPNRGDRVRAYHLVRQLARRASVHVVSLVHDDREEAEADGMRRDGIQQLSNPFSIRFHNRHSQQFCQILDHVQEPSTTRLSR